MDYDTLLIFVVDCAIVSTANFAMLKESQQFLGKQLKIILCIDILRLKAKVESDQSIKNLESVVNDDENNADSPKSLSPKSPSLPITIPSDTKHDTVDSEIP